MCWCRVLLCFFFFKQKTSYDVRISDWSSDVCSSDLGEGNGGHLLFPSLSRGRAGWGWLVLVRWRFGRCRGGWETHPHPTRPARRSAPGVRATCAAVPRRQAALTPLQGRAFWRLLGGLRSDERRGG